MQPSCIVRFRTVSNLRRMREDECHRNCYQSCRPVRAWAMEWSLTEGQQVGLPNPRNRTVSKAITLIGNKLGGRVLGWCQTCIRDSETHALRLQGVIARTLSVVCRGVRIWTQAYIGLHAPSSTNQPSFWCSYLEEEPFL